MKAFTLSKKSWHWRLAVTYGSHYKYDTDTDLCTYMWHVVQGLIVVSLTTIVGGLVIGVPYGSLLAWIVYVANYGLTAMDPPAVAAVFITAAIAFLVGLFFLFNTDAGEEVKSKVKGVFKLPKPKEDSFLVLAYRSFKDKTCVRLNME